MRVDRLFEFVCCLIRAGGIEDQGWDPIVESTALIEDLDKLSAEPIDPEKFKRPERTRARLALLSYCHLTEADFFYHVLANLARLRAGDKYNMVRSLTFVGSVRTGRSHLRFQARSSASTILPQRLAST